jgi:hypothetical protein
MIDVVQSYVADFGLLAGGGLGAIVAGRWMMRAQVVAEYARMLGIVLVVFGLAVASGVVDVDVAQAADYVRTLMGVI